MASNDILSSLGLEQLIADDRFGRDESGSMANPTGARVVFAAAALMQSMRHVLDSESPGAWGEVMKMSGYACGKKIAVHLDGRLATMGKPNLAALPLEACLVFIERYFALHGWGRLALDLTHAPEHGLVVARLEHSFFVEELEKTKVFIDPLLAGMLQGFFEHISGQPLGCEEIACADGREGQCTFVITDAVRLASIAARLGRETADAVIAHLRS